VRAGYVSMFRSRTFGLTTARFVVVYLAFAFQTDRIDEIVYNLVFNLRSRGIEHHIYKCHLVVWEPFPPSPSSDVMQWSSQAPDVDLKEMGLKVTFPTLWKRISWPMTKLENWLNLRVTPSRLSKMNNMSLTFMSSQYHLYRDHFKKCGSSVYVASPRGQTMKSFERAASGYVVWDGQVVVVKLYWNRKCAVLR
ncbi:hypothetical protein BaRGS_00003645, partial [Batillaria attramentaria]